MSPPGLAINEGASLFWATSYVLADRGNVGLAVVGGAAVAMLAYLTDYYFVRKRLTPGWEHRVSNRSLAAIYAAIAASAAAWPARISPTDAAPRTATADVELFSVLRVRLR